MEATASPVRRGEVGTRAQLALMEFPLFPVFLRAAVQTPPVPRGWAGSGKSACLPIIHLAALEREQSTQTYGEWCLHGEKSDKSLFVQHFFTFVLLSFSVRNKYQLGFSQTAGPFNITGIVCTGLASDEASGGGVRQRGWHMGGSFSSCSTCLFMTQTTGVLVHFFNFILPSLYFRKTIWRTRSTFGSHGMCKAALHSQDSSFLRFESPLKFTTSHISQLHSRLLGFSPWCSFWSNCWITRNQWWKKYSSSLTTIK